MSESTTTWFDRLLVCSEACKGMTDPQAEIAAIRLEIARWRDLQHNLDALKMSDPIGLIATLQKQVRELREAGTPVLEEMARMLKEDGGCDHSVGVCWCDYIKKLESFSKALAATEETK